jgi:hypothetical protein
MCKQEEIRCTIRSMKTSAIVALEYVLITHSYINLKPAATTTACEDFR